jgi:WS/DGAT/MGAT family acyltransferase
MRRVSNVDGSFLLAETRTQHMHVVGTLILDAGHMSGGYDYDHLKALFAQRIHLLPSFRRRIVEVPFGLDQPAWIEDPKFDLDNHLRRAAIPTPGGLAELAEFVGDYASRPLERDKPLWEAQLVEGLAEGRVAIVTKLHHAMMDGGAGAELLAVLFDGSPGGSEIEPPSKEWGPERIPSMAELLGRALLRQARRPGQALGALTAVAKEAASSAFQRAPNHGDGPSLFDAPRLSFNRALTPHRSVAFGRCSLGDLKTIARSQGAKVNDVVMAACTSALRGYLIDLDELPGLPLVASVPIAIHTTGKQASTEQSNHLSVMLIPLPVQLADPLDRLRVIEDATRHGKEDRKRSSGDVVQHISDLATALATPGVLGGLIELYSASHLADRTPPMWNTVVSNIQGPPVPLYCAGARIEAIYPMGPVVDGSGLNFTFLSNAGSMDVGIMACRELVRNVEGLATGFCKGVDELLAAATPRPSPEAS